MLQHLSIVNIALIDRLELPLGPGLIVLTGETGAGKSILVDAIGLLLGSRASGDLLRIGRDDGFVQGVFRVDDPARDTVHAVLREAGLPVADELFVRRTLTRSGPSRAWINDTPVTVALLTRVMASLVDLVGQHAHLSLLSTATQRALVDAAGDHGALRARMREEWAAWKGATDALAALRDAAGSRKERIEVLRYQLQELEGLSLRPGEWDDLEARLARLRNVGKLREAAVAATRALGDADPAASTLLSRAEHALMRASTLDPTAEALRARLAEVTVLVEDLSRDLAHWADGLELDDDIDRLEGRHEQIRRVLRKHTLDAAEVPGRIAALRDEREALENYAENLERAAAIELAARERAMNTARQLLDARRAAAERLFADVARRLAELAMPRTRLSLRADLLDASRLSAHGCDDLELLFTANPGEPLRPLAKIASGGELSRLLLAVRTALASGDIVQTLLFDEVDTGIGGATGEVVGRMLHELARDRQVLCITHLPQIAAWGDDHLRVEKRVEGEKTISTVEKLDTDARVREMARMLGGLDLTDATFAHARDLLRLRERARAHPAS